jgi:hypothetical protein
MPKLLDQVIRVTVWSFVLLNLLLPMVFFARVQGWIPGLAGAQVNDTFARVMENLGSAGSGSAAPDAFNTIAADMRPKAQSLLAAAADRDEARGAFSGIDVIVLHQPLNSLWSRITGGPSVLSLRIPGARRNAVLIIADQQLDLNLDAAPESRRALLSLEGPQAISLSGRKPHGILGGFRIQAFGARGVTTAASLAANGTLDGDLCAAIDRWREFYETSAASVSVRRITGASRLSFEPDDIQTDGDMMVLDARAFAHSCSG